MVKYAQILPEFVLTHLLAQNLLWTLAKFSKKSLARPTRHRLFTKISHTNCESDFTKARSSESCQRKKTGNVVSSYGTAYKILYENRSINLKQESIYVSNQCDPPKYPFLIVSGVSTENESVHPLETSSNHAKYVQEMYTNRKDLHFTSIPCISTAIVCYDDQ